MVGEACRTMLELHILEDAQPEAKIWKLAPGVREAKAKVGRVQLKLNMKIIKLRTSVFESRKSF